MDDRLILLFTFVISGLLTTLLAIPMILEKVKPNFLYGFRVPKTLDNPQIWYLANRYAGWRLMWAGMAISLSALVLYFVSALDLAAYAWSIFVIFCLAFGVGIWQSFIYLRKI